MKKGYNLLVLNALSFFIENPYEEIYLREFSRRLKISINTSQRFLDFFLREGFIKEYKKANLRYFKADLDSIVFKNIKITFSLKKIEKSGIIDVLKEHISHFILFGSSAEGKDNKESDFDFLVIGRNKQKIKEIFSKNEGRFNREINAHIFLGQEWKNQAKINKAFYQDIISKGICLIGEKPFVN